MPYVSIYTHVSFLALRLLSALRCLFWGSNTMCKLSLDFFLDVCLDPLAVAKLLF